MSDRKNHRQKFWNNHDISGYECPDCSRTRDEIDHFQVHHRDNNPDNGDIKNLVALCKKCHHQRHGNWTEIYSKKYRNKLVGIL